MRDLPRRFHVLFWVITILATVIILKALYQMQWNGTEFFWIATFGVLAVASESLPVTIPQGGYVTVSYAIFFAALVLFPTGVSLSIVAMGGLLVLGKGALKQPLFKRIFNAAQFVVSLELAYLVMTSFGVYVFNLNFKALLIYLLTALTFTVTNMTIVTVALAILSHKSPWSIWVGNIQWSVPNFAALAPLGMLMALVFKNYGPFGLALLSIPLLLSRHSFQRYIDMRENYLATIEALVKAIEAKDIYTRGHSERVAKYSVAVAEKLRFPESKLDCLKYMAILHDVGKIGVSESVLNKQGKLLEAEWDRIREHPVIGLNIVKDIKFLYEIGPGVRHHHERYDGSGYPDGLKGLEIPLEARIIAVADSYDAMTSDRSYRKGRTTTEAVQELIKGKGTQFDPQLVDIFCEILPQVIEIDA